MIRTPPRFRVLWLALALLGPVEAAAETLVAARTIRAREVVGPGDVVVTDAVVPGALQTATAAVGLEARVTIYAGQALAAGLLAPAAVVERNDVVVLNYNQDGLSIRTEGRALDRGPVGARLRVMNLSSKITITGTVTGPGVMSVP